MELIFENKATQFNSTVSAYDVISKINELLSDNYYYSHLIADGKEVYTDPESYISNNIFYISKLEVVTKTSREFVQEILLTARDYLRNFNIQAEKISEEFYQTPSESTWNSFSHMLEGMQWMNQVINLVDKSKERPINWNKCVKVAKVYESEIKNLEEAVENTDDILIADLIQYELSPIYKELEIEIGNLIEAEGYQYGVN